MTKLTVQTLDGPVNATVQLPGSKSITNRALVCAALAKGTSTLTGALDSDDTRVMIDSLRRLGVDIDDSKTPSLIVRGCHGSFPNSAADLFVKNSGTTIRFLTAVTGLAGGTYTLDGIERMRERPIGDLVEALQQLGVNATAHSDGACPPVTIDSARVQSGRTKVKGNLSSQYLSGLLMAAPLAAGGMNIDIVGELVSLPYVKMTLDVMKQFGVCVETTPDASKPESFSIAPDSNYIGSDYSIEPDASAASYFWAAAAICGGKVTVPGLNKLALQGDVHFVEALGEMGCQVEYHDAAISVTGPARTGIDIDMAHISDTAQTLAAVALFVDGPTTIRGIAHNRIKETDRIGNLAVELRKLGAQVDEFEDGFRINPGPLQAAEIETYDDHRMAMSLAIAGLKQPGVVICDPNCVSKTYPGFFDDIQPHRLR